MIAAYILIQTQAGKAAMVAAALPGLPGVSETASLAGADRVPGASGWGTRIGPEACQ